ncbi:MAG: YtxH domain-containing protein [Candidatus Gastranaerophilaceae bacterium]
MSKNKSFMFGMGLLAGVVGGIVAGVLLAPQSGEESRRELKEAACEL